MYQKQGYTAETVASNWLINQGFIIVDRNWRNSYVEIDIIAKKYANIFFVEVKYRKNTLQGGGFSYITKTKLRQMVRGSQAYLVDNETENLQPRLAVIAISGENFQHIEYIDDISIAESSF